MRNSSLNWPIAALLAMLLLSCSQEVVVSERTHFEQRAWHMDSVVHFSWELQDSALPVFMTMYVRHTQEYPYKNLYLFRTIESLDGVEYSDTVNVQLASALGQWHGKGLSNLKTLEIPIGQGAVRFLGDDRYTLYLQHGMRDTVLQGITDVGISFERATP